MKYLSILISLFCGVCWGQPAFTLASYGGKGQQESTFFKPTATANPLQDQRRPSVGGDFEKKNVTTAVVYSLLLPGMGELYVGNYGSGKYFTIIEGALWLTMGAYDWYATGLRDDARRFAMQHAQLNLNGKDDEYFVNIGEFRNVYDYNEQILRNRAPELLYDPSSSYWNWDSDANRLRFTDLRVASDERFNDLRFVAAAIAVNHVVSAINAARMAILHNRAAESESSSLDVHASVIGGFTHPNGILISLSKSF